MKLDTPSFEHAAEIRAAVKSKYRNVAISPEGYFAYPVGVESALKLGYDPSWLEFVPAEVSSRFVGVGNPFGICAPKPGNRVLDAGCGCGFDTFIAAALAGSSGTAVGIDITAEMLAVALAGSRTFDKGNVEFREASIEKLPFENACFDLVISNGVLNLIPDKKTAFLEIARILRPEGILVAADLFVTETIPEEVLASTDAWST